MNYKNLIIKKAAESPESQDKHDQEHLTVIEELGDLAVTTLEIRENVIDHAISDTNNEEVKEEAEDYRMEYDINASSNYRKKVARLIHKNELIDMVKSFDRAQLYELANMYEVSPEEVLKVCINHLDSGMVDSASAQGILDINEKKPCSDCGMKTNGSRTYSNYRSKIKNAQEMTSNPVQPRVKIPYAVWIQSKKSDGTTYEQWAKRVDKLVSNKFGLGMDDFPDWRSADAYEANKTVEQGYRAFVRSQGSELRGMASDYRKKILATLNKQAGTNEGEWFAEDKEVEIDGIPYSVDANISYGADFQPAEGDGFNEPHSSSSFVVGIEVGNIKATNQVSGEVVTEPDFLARIKEVFLSKYEHSLEEEISKKLEDDAINCEPDPDRGREEFI